MRPGAGGGAAAVESGGGLPGVGGIHGESSIAFDHIQVGELERSYSVGGTPHQSGARRPGLRPRIWCLAMRVGITGASGLIGSALARHLRGRGHEVVPFVRRHPSEGEIGWDPQSGVLDPTQLGGLDAVVNLAGAGIGDHRWTEEYKQRIYDSRVRGTTAIANAMAASDGPRVLLNASAVGYYGNGEQPVDETAPPGNDFLAGVVTAWEAATRPAEQAGVRVARMRSGIVLSRHGGALKPMLPIFKLALGGRFGSGRQWMSWISIDDEVAAIEHLLTSDVHGAVNLTAPNPCRNADFAKTLASVLGRPSVVPVPEFAPKLLLGAERAEALLFGGQHVLPTVLTRDGYVFRHAELEPALRAVLGRGTTRPSA